MSAHTTSAHTNVQGPVAGERVRTIQSLDEIVAAEGDELGVSDWHKVSQSEIDAIAQAMLCQTFEPGGSAKPDCAADSILHFFD